MIAAERAGQEFFGQELFLCWHNSVLGSAAVHPASVQILPREALTVKSNRARVRRPPRFSGGEPEESR